MGIYKGFEIPLPTFGYLGEKLNIIGPFVSYHLLKQDVFQFSANLSPRFNGFYSNDADIFKGMDERQLSLDAGFSLIYKKDNWKLKSSAMFDVLGRSSGYEVSTQLGKLFRFGSVFVEPNVGLSFLDAKHVGYYYGVCDHEITTSRLGFKGNSALNKTLGVSVMTPVFFKGLTSLSINNTWYDSSITDSPLTESASSLSLKIMFVNFFNLYTRHP
ncbi:MAG: MipA/OmpV family protein [Psychrobium sp.]|nr:MipA/OmpV family protein [Psychrobium sp.]